MKLLGLDFDNTLVHYDRLFHQLALEKDLIKQSVPANKTAIRDYLRRQGRDEQFTLLQGEVYGARILEAEPAEGMLKALKEIQELGIPMVLVSHKTRTPYKGPKYNLHNAAWAWLEKQSFFSNKGLNWEKSQVFFEESKEKKVARVQSLNCTHYVDDLKEILDMLPNEIKKIHYFPDHIKTNPKDSSCIHLRNWASLVNLVN